MATNLFGNKVVHFKLYKDSAQVVARRSPKNLYSLARVTFEAHAINDQSDAGGFIKLNALRLRLTVRHNRR